MKHTPGPWKAFGRDQISRADDCDDSIAYVSFWDDQAVMRANARLIAAAPELLAACELALGVITVLNRDRMEGGTIRILEDAIRKATQAD